eukprot:scaffold74594_cov37-Attheya_sp.AAC.3
MNVATQKYNVLPKVRTSDSTESVSFTKCIPDVLARTKEPQPPIYYLRVLHQPCLPGILVWCSQASFFAH